MSQIVLLGPQRGNATVARAVKLTGDSQSLAIVTAGWQEREGELDDLKAHLSGRQLEDLRLYERTEEVFHADPELLEAWRDRQEWLKELQRLYRVRLRHALRAVVDLTGRKGIARLIEREQELALKALQELDRHHLRAIRRIHFDYWQRWQPAQRKIVAHHRQEIADILSRCDTLLVAGGHVGILLNRMRLYDIGTLLGNKTLIAWSAGAMVLSERVVLFHDHPPQGAGNAEIFDAGMAAFRGIVALPDAQNRLTLDDPRRIGLLAGRLHPAASIALDEPSILIHDERRWHASGLTQVLKPDGTVVGVDL